MNLFFLRAVLRRELLLTPKFEELMEKTRLDAERYRKVEQTDKFREYLMLEKVVASSDFQAKKRELTRKKYKETEESRKMTRLAELKKDKYVRQYLKNGEGESRQSVIQYEELRKEIETEDFRLRNAFWQDANRWQGTDEGRQEARFEALKKDEDIQFYLKANKSAIEQFEQFEKVYEDDFTWTRLEASDWKPGIVYPSDKFVREHTFTNELQAYNKGLNIETADSILNIQTIKENVTAPAWDAKKGMVMKDFKYTSDIISNDKVAIEEGMVVQVKVRCRGFLNHGIYLRSKKHIPFISLFDYTGLKAYVGAKDKLDSNDHLKMLDGLQPIRYIVYTVSWQKDEIVWFVNNLEVYRTKNLIPFGEKLYMHLYSFISPKARRVTEGKLQVDWVRVYKRKK
ncbi:MAG: hypothetical protein K5660_00025 [Paludibacteraceae bacterium]|nr:hypothetical protein [Paludibacteraceae bacterium]